MSLLSLRPDEVLEEKPFTSLRHTAQDIDIMRFMVACVSLTLERPHDNPETPLVFYQPAPEHWTHRVILTQPHILRGLHPLTVVGFFGLRNPGANVSMAQKLDRGLLPELMRFSGLHGYVSILLPTGNFANLVLFASPADKEQWGTSEKHAEAVRILTPDYYAAVRLYNGELPDGLERADRLCMHLVKYYDYRERPLWRAIRHFATGGSA